MQKHRLNYNQFRKTCVTFVFFFSMLCTYISDKYPYAGQNLAIEWSKPNYPDVDLRIRNATNNWFMEHKLCDMSYIDKFRDSKNMIRHFTQMVSAGADRVGCAMTKYDNGYKTMLLACDYSFMSILNQPIYKTGKPCSKCKSGCSKSYPGLCNSNEKSFKKKD